MAFHEGRDIWLLNTEQLDGFDLSELPFPDYLTNLKGEFRLSDIFLRVG